MSFGATYEDITFMEACGVMPFSPCNPDGIIAYMVLFAEVMWPCIVVVFDVLRVLPMPKWVMESTYNITSSPSCRCVGLHLAEFASLLVCFVCMLY